MHGHTNIKFVILYTYKLFQPDHYIKILKVSYCWNSFQTTNVIRMHGVNNNANTEISCCSLVL